MGQLAVTGSQAVRKTCDMFVEKLQRIINLFKALLFFIQNQEDTISHRNPYFNIKLQKFIDQLDL
jgi:hypothetical protein